MTNRLTKRSVVTYTPAVPTVVGRPAYCTTQTETYKELVYTTPPPVPEVNTGVSYPTYTTVTKTRETTVCYPAVQGTQGSEGAATVDNQPGWNAGARSVSSFAGDGVARFSFPRYPSAAVLCGIAEAATVGDFSGITHGLYTNGGRIQVYERGVPGYIFSARAVDSPSLSITRVGSTVTYVVAGESRTSALASRGTQHLYAALYLAGDYVDSPAIGAALRMISGDGPGVGGYARESRGAANGFTLQSSDSDGVGGSAYAQNANQQAAPPVVVTSRVESVLPFVESALGNKVMNGTASATLDMSMYAANQPYAAAAGEFPFSESAYSTGAPPLTETFFETLAGISYQATDFGIFAAVSERLQLADHLDVGVFVSASLFEHLQLSSIATFSALIQASVSERLVVADRQTTNTRALQYATNLVTGAVTRYEGFGFSAFARTTGGATYGVRQDGLYRIEGSDDNGEVIQAAIDFAATSFGSNERKGLQVLYFGAATDGQLYGRLVEDNGTERTYRVVQYQDTAKLVPAQRPTSRFWRLRLEVTDATRFELDSVDWFVVSANRRITQ